MEPIILYPVIFFIGLLFGSFSNVCIIRMPKEQSILGRSICNKCKKKILWFDNIPLLSFFLLSGKCRACKNKISIQYPINELLVACIYLLTFYIFGLTLNSLYFILIFNIFFCIALIDYKHFIIPNELNYLLIGTGLLKNIDPHLNLHFFDQGLSSFVGCALGYLIIWVIIYLYKALKNLEAMGLGDAKLLAGIGAWFGVKSVFLSLFFGSVIGLVAVIPSLMKKKKGLKTAIPFGPFIILGCLGYIFFGKKLLSFMI